MMLSAKHCISPAYILLLMAGQLPASASCLMVFLDLGGFIYIAMLRTVY